MRRWLGPLCVSAALAVAPAGLGLAPALADKAANTIRFAYDQAPESIDPLYAPVRGRVVVPVDMFFPVPVE